MRTVDTNELFVIRKDGSIAGNICFIFKLNNEGGDC